MPKVVVAYKVKGTNKVVRVLCGASTLAQVLIIPKGVKVSGLSGEITMQKAIDITGNEHLLRSR